MNINNSLIVGLTRAANHFVIKMKERISNKKLPRAISDATAIGTANVSGDTASIVVTIDLEKAPMAAAFEWGSGIHSTKEKPEKYRIPNLEGGTGKKLKIPAERWPNKSKSDDPAYLPFVMHPGVEANSYIRPTIVAELPELKRIIGQEVKAAILIGIKEMFST